MNRYTQTFSALKEKNKIGFVPFWMLGDPTPEKSLEIILEKIAPHADVLELGIPFSDPLADGPTIQASVGRALDAGTTTVKCLELVSKIRAKFPTKPIGLLVYFNLILNFLDSDDTEGNIDSFFKTAHESGVDSVLIPELPIEEVSIVEEVAKKYEIDLIFLVSTNTPTERVQPILEKGSGFLYAISTPSITGAKTDIAPETLEMIKSLKTQTDLPICVGFGISSPDHIAKLKEVGADGAIIGSKLFQFRENLDELQEFCKKCQEAA